jgi:hypothetical protein
MQSLGKQSMQKGIINLLSVGYEMNYWQNLKFKLNTDRNVLLLFRDYQKVSLSFPKFI